MADGTLLVFSGPAGAGKAAVLIEYLKTNVPGVWKSVSYTTRAPRDGEVDGVDDKFVSVDEFEKLIESNFFL